MKRRDDVLVGLVISLAIALGIVGTLWLVRGGLTTGYPMFARFPWGYGIKQGQGVLLSGVNVGFVGQVDLIPDGTLLVTMRIDKHYHIPQGTSASIEPNGIFGDVEVALRPRQPTSVYLSPGDTVPIGPTQPGLQEVAARMDTIAIALGTVVHTMQTEFVQAGGIADLRKTAAGTSALVAKLSVIAGEQSRDLSLTMQSVRHMVSAIDSAAVDSAVHNMQATTANLQGLSANLRATSTKLDDILARADSGTGTAAMLLNNPGLYDHTVSLLAQLDSLSGDLKRHPGRYINLKIF
jgi:phospholipid/cholesterol/gamma-HCH transport system substrate-binding protein